MQKSLSQLKRGGVDALKIFTTVIFSLFVILAASRIFIGINYFLVDVDGISMEGTLLDGDCVYAFHTSSARRGDIVVIDAGDRNIIKRVIALGGDTVELKAGVLYLNGGKVDEPYVLPENNSPDLDKNSFDKITVAEGYIFFMGDNRDVSEDSRAKYGAMPMEKLVGVVADWSVRCKKLVTFNARFGI